MYLVFLFLDFRIILGLFGSVGENSKSLKDLECLATNGCESMDDITVPSLREKIIYFILSIIYSERQISIYMLVD